MIDPSDEAGLLARVRQELASLTLWAVKPTLARNGMAAFARTPVLPEAILVGPLSAEAVRKGDVQEPMRERPGSAVEFAGGLDFHTERDSSRPDRLDHWLHPEDGDHPLQIVRERAMRKSR